MKCATGDIIPSLTRLKKHRSELKFFVSIFGKFQLNQYIKSRRVASFKNNETFSKKHLTIFEGCHFPRFYIIDLIEFSENRDKDF